MKNKYRKPHYFKKKRSLLREKIFWISLVSLFLSLGIIYFIFFSSFFQIKEIRVFGQEKINGDEIAGAVEKGTADDFLFFEMKNILLLDETGIRNGLMEDFPLLAKVEITRDFPDALDVSISERVPLATFCGGENCFSVDESGVVFEMRENSLLNPVIKNPWKNVSLGENIVPEEELEKILDIYFKIENEAKVDFKEIILSETEKWEVLTGENWLIFLNPLGDLDWQITKLTAVLEEKIPEENRENLEYIELRFGNLAPFRYSNQ